MYRFENYPRSILHFQKSLFTHKKEGLDAYTCTIHWRFYAVKKKKRDIERFRDTNYASNYFWKRSGFFEKKFVAYLPVT